MISCRNELCVARGRAQLGGGLLVDGEGVVLFGSGIWRSSIQCNLLHPRHFLPINGQWNGPIVLV